MTELPTNRRDPRKPVSLRFAEWCHLIPDNDDIHGEAYWPVYVAIIAAIGWQVFTPLLLSTVVLWILPVVEAVLLVALVLGRYLHPSRQNADVLQRLRQLGIVLVAIATASNLLALFILARQLLNGSTAEGSDLILAAIAIWSTNLIIFGIWYWELDGGGPIPRRGDPDGPRDFLFPQLTLMHDEKEQRLQDERAAAEGEDVQPAPLKYAGWFPSFVDYLFLSFTSSTTFGPADTLPLTRRAKLLMMVQSSAALLTLALVAARAVNILRAG